MMMMMMMMMMMVMMVMEMMRRRSAANVACLWLSYTPYPTTSPSQVSTYNSDTGSFIRRNSRAVADDPYAVQLIKLPPVPIPISWGRQVKPWAPPAPGPRAAAKQGSQKQLMGKAEGKVPAAEGGQQQQDGDEKQEGSYEEHTALESCDFGSLQASVLNAPAFQAVFINSGWEASGGIERLSKLPIPKLCPVGFVFAWVPKALLQGFVRLMYSWDYVYVENLTWVQTAPSNALLEQQSDYLRKSHLSLYIFRKNGIPPPPPPLGSLLPSTPYSSHMSTAGLFFLP